jgi:transaldolase
MRVNMTLVFSQSQAAAVHAATHGARKGDVFVSPFIGRLDDIDLDGMDLITNIQTMYKMADSHVSLLVASVRDLEHFLYALYTEVDIITSPLKVLQLWADAGKPVPGIDIPVAEFVDENSYLNRSAHQDIFYEELDLEQDWRKFQIAHELTDKGIAKFSSDWNALIS